MSQWTSLSLILTLGLILLGLSAEAAAAADDLPRNIEWKPGAAVSDEKTGYRYKYLRRQDAPDRHRACCGEGDCAH